MRLGSTHFYNSQIRKGGPRREGEGTHSHLPKAIDHGKGSHTEESSPRGLPQPLPMPPYPHPLSRKEETGPTALRVSKSVEDLFFRSE